MNEKSKPFSRTISTDSVNVISLPDAASGHMPFAWPDGLMTDLFGPVPVLADHLASPASKKVSKTRAIFGRHGFRSSSSAGLTCALVSNLMTRTRGSILYRLTWKTQATPSGRLIYQLRASPARISDNDTSGWPTPTTPSGGQSVPLGTTASGLRPDGSKATVTLENVVQMSGWHTPTLRDFRTPHSASLDERGWKSKGESLGNQVIHEGPALTGSSAEMARIGRLNPAHARWLMRLPPVWDDCGITAMPSTRKRRPTS